MPTERSFADIFNGAASTSTDEESVQTTEVEGADSEETPAAGDTSEKPEGDTSDETSDSESTETAEDDGETDITGEDKETSEGMDKEPQPLQKTNAWLQTKMQEEVAGRKLAEAKLSELKQLLILERQQQEAEKPIEVNDDAIEAFQKDPETFIRNVSRSERAREDAKKAMQQEAKNLTIWAEQHGLSEEHDKVVDMLTLSEGENKIPTVAIKWHPAVTAEQRTIFTKMLIAGMAGQSLIDKARDGGKKLAKAELTAQLRDSLAGAGGGSKLLTPKSPVEPPLTDEQQSAAAIVATSDKAPAFSKYW